jgi:transcriptional regulator with XRE-family HTH domain
MVSRIRDLISQLEISDTAFAKKCGVKQNTFSNQLSKLREVSLTTIIGILNAYPDVSAEWLLRGKGEMFLTDSKDINQESSKLMKLVDTISILQEVINNKTDMIASLTAKLKKYEDK